MYDKAINMAKAALTYLPQHPAITYSLANIYGKKGDYPEGEKLYLSAVKLDPNNPSYHLNLGKLLFAFNYDTICTVK